MSEEINATVSTESTETVDTQGNVDTVQEEKHERTFTRAEIGKMLSAERSKWEAEQEAKENEAEKLRKMNADEKAEYEAKKQAAYIAELEAKINRSGLEKEASKMLSESGIAASDEILALVVKDDAERTQEAVNGFAELVNQLADNKVKEMLKGKTPRKVEQSTAGAITKEQFDRMGYKDRNELLHSNPELYAQLKG